MIALLLLLSTVGEVSPAKSLCNEDQFFTCQKSFTDALGISSAYNYLDPIDLGQQIQNIYAQTNKNGLVFVCNAYNDFLDCLNSDSYTAFECFDPNFLIHTKADPYRAYMYSFLMNMQQYQCGAGFYPAVENWSCLQKIYTNQNATLNNCVSQFWGSVQDQPVEICNSVQTGMKCWQNAVKGCPRAVNYYACESFRQYTIPLYGFCYEQCQF